MPGASYRSESTSCCFRNAKNSRERAGRGVVLGSESVRTYHHIAAVASSTPERCWRKRRSPQSVRDLWHYQVKYSEHCPSPEKWRRSQGTCDDAAPPSRLSNSHPFWFFFRQFRAGRASISGNDVATTSRVYQRDADENAPSDDFARSGCKPCRLDGVEYFLANFLCFSYFYSRMSI